MSAEIETLRPGDELTWTEDSTVHVINSIRRFVHPGFDDLQYGTLWVVTDAEGWSAIIAYGSSLDDVVVKGIEEVA